tara:strand:+ start:289 stop:495 length:207 start_codon:yes stop_codon:yes gene_type:complete
MAKKKKDEKGVGVSVTTISLIPRGLPPREGQEPPKGAKDSVVRANALNKIMERLLKAGLFDSTGKDGS